MQDTDRRRYEVLARVRDFGETYGHLFPDSSLAAQAFAAVTSAVAALDTNDVAETTASVSARATRKQAARQALRERLLLVANTAQVLPGADAELKAHFTVSPWVNDQVLLTAARQCMQRATPLAAQFVAHGMPATFLEDVTVLIDRFEEAIRDRGLSRGQLVAARTAIQTALTSGFKAIKQLDVIVANHLASDPVAQEVWKRGRRMRSRSGPRKEAAVVEHSGVTPPPLPTGLAAEVTS